MIDLAQVPTTEAELTARYAARKALLLRQLDALAARRRMAIVTIPSALRQAGSINRTATYRIALPDGQMVVATGAELVRICGPGPSERFASLGGRTDDQEVSEASARPSPRRYRPSSRWYRVPLDVTHTMAFP